MPETTRKDPLSVEFVPDAAGLRALVAGELDMATAAPLREKLNGLTPHQSMLVVDLSGVDFMDSTGLGVLIEQVDRWTTAGGALRVSGARGQVKWLLGITGLELELDDAGEGEARPLAST